MNKSFIALLLLVVSFTSCEKIDELTKFNLDYTTNYTIQSTTIIDAPLNIITPDVTTNAESEFESNNTRKNLIESIKLRELRMDLQTPEDGNFDFINEIVIYIKAEGLEEVQIASASNIPENASKRLELEVENIELKEYIKKDSYTLRVETVTDQAITRDHNISIYTLFRVDAEILGV